jgi:hypothetical protein
MCKTHFYTFSNHSISLNWRIVIRKQFFVSPEKLCKTKLDLYNTVKAICYIWKKHIIQTVISSEFVKLKGNQKQFWVTRAHSSLAKTGLPSWNRTLFNTYSRLYAIHKPIQWNGTERKFLALYEGPYQIKKKLELDVYVLSNPETAKERGIFHVANLKLFFC